MNEMTPPPTPPEQPPTPTPDGSGSDPSFSQWSIALHLSPLIGFVIPFGNIFAPLIIWLIKKAEMPSIDPVGKAVLNFQISWTLWTIASTIIAVVGSCLIVPMFLPFVSIVAMVVFMVMAAVKASNSEGYTYPWTITFLR